MNPASRHIHALAHSLLAHLTGAFLVMGSWAFFANRGHAFDAAVTAAALQGTISACVTLSLKTFIERIAPRFAGRAALAVPPLAAFTLVGAVLTLLHSLNGTPELLATIALPLVAATGYAAVYNFAIWKKRRTAGT
ncbi:hypothetical protein [Pelagibius sp. 7325]|uniref:hypothetical protein n=1 Tax=Pelagibius sp. 7325 TaxID=3131994 RepID=UPI0030EB6CF6